MSEIMTREELLTLFTKMIRLAERDYDGFEDAESRRKFMNSIVSAGTQYHTVQSREELVNLKEILAEIKEWRESR